MTTPQIRSENIQFTIEQLNEDFAGRTNLSNYDPTKTVHIHRRNRAYVWSREMQLKLLDSILKGYPIPPLYCCSKIEEGSERRYVMEGGNRITTFRKILNNEVRNDLTPEELRKVCCFPITLVVMRNLTSNQQREMFRRLNKNIKVSDGQLYAMSEEDSPIVQEALALLNDPSYPLRATITDVFFDTVGKDNDRKQNLENAIAIVSGAYHGVTSITKSFPRQESNVESQAPIDRSRIINLLTVAFGVFKLADTEFPLQEKAKKKSQFTIGNFLGAILYDLLTNPELVEEITNKWKNYIVLVRRNVEYASDAIDIKGAQNINPDKLKKKSYKVDVFMKEQRIASEEEIKSVKHIYSDGHICDDIEDEDEIVEESAI
jgi:hypothetical protein